MDLSARHQMSLPECEFRQQQPVPNFLSKLAVTKIVLNSYLLKDYNLESLDKAKI